MKSIRRWFEVILYHKFNYDKNKFEKIVVERTIHTCVSVINYKTLNVQLTYMKIRVEKNA